MKNKITITDLIAKKDILRNRKKATAEIETEIGIITIVMSDKALVSDAIEMGRDGGDEYLCYECVSEPNLKDKKLQETFDCASPLDIVGKIFKPGEIATIATLIMRHAGYNDGKADFVKKMDEEIKN